MTHRPFVLSLVAVAGTAVGQDGPVRFVTRSAALVSIAVHDAPGFLAATSSTRLGTMLADPDIAEAFGGGVQRFRQTVQKWIAACNALEALDPDAVDWTDQVQRDLWALDWRDLRSIELTATSLDRPESIQTTVILEPVAAAEERLATRFGRLADAVWKRLGATDAPAEQKIDGFPARIARSAATGGHDHAMDAGGAWFVHVPGQFAAGTGSPAAAGQCRKAPVQPPGVSVRVDVGQYLAMLTSVFGESEPFTKVMNALGLGEACQVEWRVAPHGELLQDDITLVFGKLAGLPAALVHAAAPLVDQPLPENALLQIRCAFDVRELTSVIDELLALAGMQTLHQLGLAEDLHKAWTGGVALGVSAPVGSPVPRVFASFGIVDAAALDRLLVRLTTEPWAQKKDVMLEDRACVQLKLPDAPPALSPTWCVQDGVIHFAESGSSMRALLKAMAANAPRALGVGDAPRPDGKGAIVPGFDLRYDGAAMYAAYRDTWLPLLEMTMGSARAGLGGSFGAQPLLQRKDLPDSKTMAGHLVRGRGMLRQHPDRLVLSMNGTAGGPALLALLTTFGPTLSPSMMWSWHWADERLSNQVLRVKLERTHAAIEAFTKRTGKRPESLGDLIGTELADASMLVVDGDETTEAVLRDGKEVGRTSFRYYRDAVEAEPQGEKVKVHLIAITARQWSRMAVGVDGTLHDGYGEFATKKIDDFGPKR